MNRKELINRYERMKELELSGLSSREIGEREGISGTRVRYILGNPMPIRRYNRERDNEPEHKTREDYRIKIIRLLGNRCNKCGYDSDIRALQVDHINGGGRDDRKEHGGSMYLRILERLESGIVGEYQILCANCNWIKRMENREHKKSTRVNYI